MNKELKELNTLITIAKDINDLVEIIACDEISRQDLEEVDQISPGIKELIMAFEDWTFDNIKTETKPEIVVTPVVPQKKTITMPEKSTGNKRNNIPKEDVVKMAKIICSMVPDEGIKVDNAFCKQVSNKVAESKLNKYISSRMVIPRLVYQLTYKKITSKYYTFEKGMLFKKK